MKEPVSEEGTGSFHFIAYSSFRLQNDLNTRISSRENRNNSGLSSREIEEVLDAICEKENRNPGDLNDAVQSGNREGNDKYIDT